VLREPFDLVIARYADSNLRKEVMQQLQSLGYRARPEYRDASGVATRSVEARY
jgi:hypothetical protein